ILRKNVVVLFAPATAPAPVSKETKEKAQPQKGKTKAAKAKTGKKPKATKDSDEDQDDKGDKIKITDLMGKRIGVIGRSQANLDLLKIILRQYGISADSVVELKPNEDPNSLFVDRITVIHFDPNDVASAVRENKVDAIMAVGPVSSTITAAAITA